MVISVFHNSASVKHTVANSARHNDFLLLPAMIQQCNAQRFGHFYRHVSPFADKDELRRFLHGRVWCDEKGVIVSNAARSKVVPKAPSHLFYPR